MNASNYRLSPQIRYRREAFGGITFDSNSKECRFYDIGGAFTLEHFATPKPLDSVKGYFAKDREASGFLANLIEHGILTPYEEGPAAKTFFTNVTDFPDNRLATPLGIELELTLQCGRNCTYCAYESGPGVRSPGALTSRQYANLFERFDCDGVCYLRFTGGDPLIRPDSLEIIAAADAHPFALTLASDLTVLTEKIAAELARLENLFLIQTTLDGPTSEIADKQRGRGNFNKVCEGIALLRNLGINVMVGTVVTTENVNFIYDTAVLLKKWDVSYFVSPLYAAGRGRRMERLIPSDEDLQRAFEQFSQACTDGLIRPADPAWDPLVASFPETMRSTLWHGQPWLVRSPDRVLRIDPNGRCYAGIHLKEFLGESVYIGDITRSELKELWNTAPLLNRLRSLSYRNPYFGEVLNLRERNVTERIQHEYSTEAWAAIAY